MHIPKTSGTALASCLLEALRNKRMVQVLDRMIFGTFTAFDTIERPLRRMIHFDFLDIPADADLATGHVSFSTLHRRYPEGQHVTFLREPFTRLLSCWIYLRGQTDEQLRPWGEWAEVVRDSRRPLAEWLGMKNQVNGLDNFYIRTLLWPHPLVPIDDFIDPRHDDILLNEAVERLSYFAYLDVVENPNFEAGLQTWLGRPFVYRRENETPAVPASLRTVLHKELSGVAFNMMCRHTRLDLKLWSALARQRIPGVDIESLRIRTLMLNTARYAGLLSESGPGNG